MEAYDQAASSNTQYLQVITDQLKELDKSVKGKSVSCIDQTCQINQEDSSTNSESDESTPESEAALRVIEDTFEESLPLASNKINHWNKGSTRNFYPRPTPRDLQHEERGSFVSSNFNGKSIYQWNIDGKAEHKILSTLQEMYMAYQSYKVQSISNAVAAVALVVGFAGQLKSWWDNILTQEQRDAILSHKCTRRNSSGMDVEEEDAVECLIHTITLLFIGSPKR